MILYLVLLPARRARELPIFYKLGETNAEVYINTAEENRNAAISLAKQARHGINIFTQDLDALIYDNDEFEKCATDLARIHPSSQIRILVIDSSKAVQNGHRLIRLAQNLTSSVFIKKPSRDHQGEKSSVMLADGVGMLYRMNDSQYNFDASINFMAPQRAGKLSDFFNEAWEHGEPDPQFRRLYV